LEFSDVPCDEVDNQLFRASTTVLLGNGRKAKFWESAWLDGMAPRDVALRLYKLAWRKKLTVAEDLQNSNWTRGLWRMSTADEIAEFIQLWLMIQEVRLNQLEDQIAWRLTTDGSYSSKSSYEIQFLGSFCTINCTAIWKARTEGKQHLFTWLWLQRKILTADKLLLRNWPSSPTCPMCNQELESAAHISLNCVFAQQVWLLVSWWTLGRVMTPPAGADLQLWWNSTMHATPKELKRGLAAALIYTAWNLWKERNKRVFDHISSTPQRVFSLIKEDFKLRVLACGDLTLPHRGF
jgi:hypothetical protein